MQNRLIKLPIYSKLSFILLSIGLIILVVYLAQQLIIPILIALLIAILLNPLFRFINKKLYVPRIVAIIITVLLFVCLFLGILFFISWQISDVAKDSDKITTNLGGHYDNLRFWIRDNLGFSLREQKKYIDNATGNLMNGNNKIMGNTLATFTSSVFNTVLVPIYIFLILLYQGLFVNFLYKMVKVNNHSVLKDILTNVNTILKSYIVGLLIQMAVIGVLTTTGLMLLGVQYAILLGVITALLNLIPYIGIMIAIIIAMLATLINSNDFSLMIGVAALYAGVQFIDNNILVPRIVGNKVRINALASILGVITGGAIAGIAGMFLAIPLLAIIKVIFDRIETLSPWGYLIGDDQERVYTWPKVQLEKILKSTGLNRYVTTSTKTDSTTPPTSPPAPLLEERGEEDVT